MDRPLWRPSESQVRHANMARFMTQVEADWGKPVASYEALYTFSIENKERFWASLKTFAGIRAETWGERVFENPDRMPGARWFPEARLNFAENLLRRRDDSAAIVFRGENQIRRRLS